MAITDEFPTGHASLSDGTTTIPFIFTDGQGKKNERAFSAAPYPRQALKTITGESKYSDLEPPYFAIPQDDFTGGRGNEDFESDTSRYFDGHWLDTTKEDGIVLGGRETYGTGYQNTDQAMPGSMVFQGVYNAPRRYLAVSFVASAAYETYQCEIWVRGVDTPTYDLVVELWSDDTGPDAMLCTKTITAANITSDTLSLLVAFAWSGAGSNETLVSGRTYWVVIDGGDSATSTRHWAIGCDAATAGKKKAAAGSWSATTYSPYFRITPAANTWDYVTFFEYKRGLYMFTRDDNVASKLYINGDRGACDVNADLSTLVDSDGGWTTNEWEGCYVILTDTQGTEEGITWRLISSNTATALTVSPDWTVTHTTSDSYVIVGSNKWTYIRDLDEVRDHTVANDLVFFTTQDSGGIVRYRAYNASGTWTEEETNVANDCDNILYIKPPGEIHGYLHCVKSQAKTLFNRQPYYFSAQIPAEASGSYYLEQPVSLPFSTQKFWEGAPDANVAFYPGEYQANFNIADGHTTGIIGAQNYDPPIDLTRGRYVSVDLQATIGITASDYQLCISDLEDLAKTWSPVKVLKEDYSTNWSPDKVFKADYGYSRAPSNVYLWVDFDGATPTFTDLDELYDGTSASQSTVTITADDMLCVGFSSPFNKFYVDVGSTPNVVADRTLNAYAFNGQDTIALNATDGTKVADSTYRTLAQDGTVSWTIPENWVATTLNGVEAYWVVCTFSGDLTPSVILKSIWVTLDEAATMTPLYDDLTNAYDGDLTTDNNLTLAVADYLYVGNGTKFNSMYVNVGTANDTASVMTGAYWNGSVWTAVTIVDGTNPSSPSAGDTLKQNGFITFDIPEDWGANTVNAAEAYWIRLDVSVALATTFSINEITVTADDANAPKTYIDMVNAYDGHVATDHNLTLAVADYLYVGNGTKFNKITVDIGTANDISSVMTGAYWNGSVWTAVTIVDNTKSNSDTLKQDGTITFTIPNDWEANTVNGTETYWIRLDVATALTAMFSINEITVTNDAYKTVNIPALTANVWEHFQIAIARHANPYIDWSAIKSIGLKLTVDRGAHSLYVKNFQVVENGNQTKHLLPTRYSTKGIVEYAGNVDDPVNNPWIITEAGIFEVQTQNNDQIVPLPLKEVAVFRSEDTGFAATVNGNYLYFNLGKRLERYFNRTMDDIGPDRDAGLPANRQGFPSTLVSYPGRVFTGIDAQSGYSSVLVLKGSSWHEVYRAPRIGMRIRDAIIHTIPDTDVHHLWVSMGDDVVKVPINLNPYYESDFKFTHEGHLITSYIYANLLDVQKTWKSLKVFAENVTTTRNIVADYQTEGSSTWIEIGTFDTVPVEEIDIASTFPQAKRIRYRLRFFTEDQDETPRMKAIVTEGVAFVPVKYQYSWTFAIKKTTEGIDLTGAWNATLTSVQEYDQLVTWANAGTQLTLLHHSNVYNNKVVFMDPVSVSPFRVVDDQDIENHVASLTCFEV